MNQTEMNPNQISFKSSQQSPAWLPWSALTLVSKKAWDLHHNEIGMEDTAAEPRVRAIVDDEKKKIAQAGMAALPFGIAAIAAVLVTRLSCSVSISCVSTHQDQVNRR